MTNTNEQANYANQTAKTPVKKIVLIIAGVLVVLLIAACAAFFTLRVDASEAREKAIDAAGGGEIVSEEISEELLSNEYTFKISNGDKWYEVEINTFGHVEEMETHNTPWNDSTQSLDD